MKFLRTIPSNLPGCGIFLSVVLLLGAVQSGHGQNVKLDLKSLDKLASKATEVNDVTLDENMLKMTFNRLTSDEVKRSHPEKAEKIDKARKLWENLKGVYVKNFTFDKENEYSMDDDVEPILAQLNGSGWSRLVMSKNNKHGGELDEIYVMKDTKDPDKSLGMAIVVAEPKELTVVNIVGSLELSQLEGLGQLGKLSKLAEHGDDSAGTSSSDKTDKTDKQDK